jgi:hypothetical protein
MIRRSRVPVLKWAGGLAVLAGLLLALIVMRNQRVDPAPPTYAQAPVTAPDPATEAADASGGGTGEAKEAAMPPLLAVDLGKLQRWTAPLDQPLQEEIQLVVLDTKAALNGLANSFFPEKVRATVLGAQRN